MVVVGAGPAGLAAAACLQQAGVQTLLLSSLQLARDRGDVGLAVRWLSENPARLLDLYPRKGALEPGSETTQLVRERAARAGLAVRAQPSQHSRAYWLAKNSRNSMSSRAKGDLPGDFHGLHSPKDRKVPSLRPPASLSHGRWQQFVAPQHHPAWQSSQAKMPPKAARTAGPPRKL